MSQLLKQGQTLNLVNGGNLTVQALLGSGGQGEVYRVSVGKDLYALKWYFDHTATVEQRKNIENLVKIGAPSTQFLWPIDIVTQDGNNKGLGYLMRLRTSEYKSLFDLMKRRANPSFRALITATYQLAESFQLLHAKGLCYRDISHGNVFFNDKNGNVLICDNDNATMNGTSMNGVVGTPRFMAPEIVRAEADPSADSDLFSLSVLLFYMLMIHHPLEGQLEANMRCFDQPAMNLLYGKDPVFIFNPADTRNYPVKGYQDNALIYWNIYPKFLKDLFTKAFVQGLQAAHRTRESEWKRVLMQLRDSIIECSSCAAENFADADKARDQHDCWSCNRKLPPFMMLRLDRQHIPLHTKTQLHPHHLDRNRPYDFSEVLASVNQHPQDPSVWGLKNQTSFGWQSTPTNGATQVVEPSRSVRLALGTKLDFGGFSGEIV